MKDFKNNPPLFSSLLLGMALFGSPTAWASPVTASGSMTASNLRFSSTDPNSQLTWIDRWYGTAVSHSQDTASGQSDDFQDLLGNDGSITAPTSTAHANAKVDYSISDGASLGTGGGSIFLTVQAQSGGNGAGGQSYVHASGGFDNYFTVEGGTPGDPVEVTFRLDYSGNLDISGGEGSYQSAISALLKLENLNGDILVSDLVQDVRTGEAQSVQQTYNGTLLVTVPLLYGGVFWLAYIPDLEHNTIPEPGTLLLFAAGLGAALRGRRSKTLLN
jgi:hypothetical protein